MAHFVYMVRCADRSLYTGYSTDPETRVAKQAREPSTPAATGRWSWC